MNCTCVVSGSIADNYLKDVYVRFKHGDLILKTVADKQRD